MLTDRMEYLYEDCLTKTEGNHVAASLLCVASAIDALGGDNEGILVNMNNVVHVKEVDNE